MPLAFRGCPFTNSLELFSRIIEAAARLFSGGTIDGRRLLSLRGGKPRVWGEKAKLSQDLERSVLRMRKVYCSCKERFSDRAFFGRGYKVEEEK